MQQDLHKSCLILFHFVCFCLLLQWNWKIPIIKSLEHFSILRWIMPDLNLSHGKMSDFVSVPLLGLTLVIKLRNFSFETHLNIEVTFEYVILNSVWYGGLCSILAIICEIGLLHFIKVFHKWICCQIKIFPTFLSYSFFLVLL